MNKEREFNAIGDILYQELLTWGLDPNSMVIEDKKSELLDRKIITGERASIAFKVILELKKELNGALYNENPLNQGADFPHMYIWKIRFFYFLKNTNNIKLTLEKATLGQKISRLFGGAKTRVYHKEFDKTFTLWCNHRYAYADILSLPIQEKMLAQINYCSLYTVLKDRIRYETTLDPLWFRKSKNYFMELFEIGFLLAQNIENWEIPIEHE